MNGDGGNGSLFAIFSVVGFCVSMNMFFFQTLNEIFGWVI
jgi:hypothetical protein